MDCQEKKAEIRQRGSIARAYNPRMTGMKSHVEMGTQRVLTKSCSALP